MSDSYHRFEQICRNPKLHTFAFTIVGLILFGLFGVYLLGEQGIITDEKPLYGVFFALLGVWYIVYAGLSYGRGQFDILGPVLSFTRFRRPILFAVLTITQVVLGGSLIYGATRLFI